MGIAELGAVRRIIGLLLFLFPLLGLGQTIDPGDIARDSALTAKSSADSVHHTDTVHFHYNYAGTGTFNTTTHSLQSFLLNNALKFSLLEKSSAINFTNNWIYGKTDRVLTNNDYTSSLDFDVYKTLEHFYYWGLATYTTSVSLLIHSQAQFGLGPGYNIIDKKTAALLVSEGVIYEKGDLYDSLYDSQTGNIYQHDVYHAFRNSLHVLYHWVIKGKYTLDGSGFIQNSFADISDYNLRLTGSASVKLEKWLAFTAAAAYNKFTRTRSSNTLLTFGLTITR